MNGVTTTRLIIFIVIFCVFLIKLLLYIRCKKLGDGQFPNFSCVTSILLGFCIYISVIQGDMH